MSDLVKSTKSILAEMEDMAAWIDRTKPQGVLYSSCMPALREGVARIRALEAERDEVQGYLDRANADFVALDSKRTLECLQATQRAEAAEALLGKVGEVLGELIHTVIHAEGAETYTGLIRRANDLRAALHAEIIASQTQPTTEDSGGDLAGDGGA